MVICNPGDASHMQLNFSDTASLLEARSESELLQRVQLCTRTLGFDQCLLAFEYSPPQLPKRHHVLSGYPAAWQAEYGKQQYVEIDPTVAHCLSREDPVIWTEGLFLGEERREALWETARGFGLGFGLSVPTHDKVGPVSSMFSVARDQGFSSGKELLEVIAGAKTIAAVAHVAACKLVLPIMAPSPPELTRRELEILKYIAIGKNRWEIATILALSESAVAFHTGNLLRKFDSSNRTQIAAKAIAFGLV